MVAQAGGEYGQVATDELVRLDLPSNPGAYIRPHCNPDDAGNLVVFVKNDTSVQLTGVRVAVQYTDSAGRPQRADYEIRGQIPPGQIAGVNTGLGPYTAGSSCPAQIVSAQIVE